jgi:dihydroneopterin aldolase
MSTQVYEYRLIERIADRIAERVAEKIEGVTAVDP